MDPDDLPGDRFDEDVDPGQFRGAADRFVENSTSHDLDYTVASLTALDSVASSETETDQRGIDEHSDHELARTVEQVGGYFGETIVERHGGTWTYTDEGWTVEVERDGAVVNLPIFRATLSVLHGDRTFAGIHGRFTNRWRESGTGDVADVGDLAAAQADTVASVYGAYDLDFTGESLARVDDLFEHQFTAARAVEEATDELLAEATPFGAYFGEVLRREHDAVWVDRDGLSIFLETDEGGAVGVDVVQTAATCLAGNATFEEAYEDLLASR